MKTLKTLVVAFAALIGVSAFAQMPHPTPSHRAPHVIVVKPQAHPHHRPHMKRHMHRHHHAKRYHHGPRHAYYGHRPHNPHHRVYR